jgi:hypothetical protein
MPVAYIDKLVDQGKGSRADLEKKWDKAKKLAADQGHSEEYDYIVGIFKKMIGESHLKSFKQFINMLEDGEPTTSVSSGGVDNPDPKKLFNKVVKRKKKKELIDG